jgi:high-affinity Fe2+/Pb2+ permease
MGNQSRNIGRKFQQKLGLWMLLISAGVIAYGLGMWQGSQFRMNRMIASIAKPVVASGLAPTSSGLVGPSNTPGNTESPKTRSK